MKKQLFAGLLCAAVFVTVSSCVKTSDIALLTHMGNLTVVAEFNPEMGAPLGYGDLKAEDLLQDFNFGGHNVQIGTDNNGVMTFYFDTSWNKHFTFGTKTSSSHSDTIHSEVPMNLFEAVDGIQDDMELKEILTNMSGLVKVGLNAKGRQLISDYNLQVILTNITLKGIGADGVPFKIQEYTTPTTYNSDMAANGFRWENMLEDEDVLKWVKKDMNTMMVDVAYTTDVPNLEALVAGEGLTPAQIADLAGWIDQNVKIEYLDITADMHIDIPFKCRVTNLEQTLDVNFNVNDIMGGSGSGNGDLVDAINIDVDQGDLIIEVVNSMPLDVDLNFTVDSNGQDAYTLLQAPWKVAGAKMQSNGDCYYSADTTHTVITVPLNAEVMRYVRKATQMQVVTKVNTGTTMVPGSVLDNTVPVAVRNTDKLQMRLYVKAKTNLDVNITAKNNTVR